MKNNFKKIIGLDLDGVIIDHQKMKVQLAGNFGFQLTPSQTDSNLMTEIIPAPILKKIRNLLYGDPEFSMQSPLMPGALEALAKLKAKKMAFSLISRRKNPAPAKKLIQQHGLWPLYFNDANTYFVRQIKDKNQKAKELGITHYLDDEAVVIAALEAVPNRFLFDRFQALPNNDWYQRVHSWDEFLKNL